LRWTHEAPSEVAGFKVHWGTSPSRVSPYSTTIDVGKPTPEAHEVYGYVFSYDLEVPDAATVYVAVTAYQDGRESPYSNERERLPEDTSSANDGETLGSDDGSDAESFQPDPYAIWFDDFEANSTGSQVSGWVDTQPGNSLLEDDSLFAVADLAGNRVFTTSSTATDIHSHYVSAASSSWTDYEVQGRLRASATDSRLGVTAYSYYTQEAALYRLSSNWSTGELELHWFPQSRGDQIECASKGTGIVPSTNTWYRFRFQVRPEAERNVLRAKVWEEGGAEPANWQAECFDLAGDRPTAGTVGVWSGRGGVKYWDDLQVIWLAGGAGDESGDSGDWGGSNPGVTGTPYLVEGQP